MELHLANNRLGDKGAKILVEALASNNTVTALDLASNELSERSGAVLESLISSRRARGGGGGKSERERGRSEKKTGGAIVLVRG